MKKTIKNTVAILILISAANLWAQKGKQEIMYREDSKFIQPTLSEDLIISTLPSLKTKISKVDAALKEMTQKNNIIGFQIAIVSNNKIIETMHYALSNLQKSVLVDFLKELGIGFCTNSGIKNSVIAPSEAVGPGMYICPEENVSILILANSNGLLPENYLKKNANLYTTEKNN